MITNYESFDDQSMNVRKAQQYKVPIVTPKFIEDCVGHAHCLEINSYLLSESQIRKPEEQVELLQRNASFGALVLQKNKNRVYVRPPVPKVQEFEYKPELWDKDDQLSFPEDDYEIIRADIMQKITSGEIQEFFVVEFHLGFVRESPSNVAHHQVAKESLPVKSYRFRIFTHYGSLDSLCNQRDSGKKTFREINTIEEAEVLYSHLIDQKIREGYTYTHLMSPKIGSEKAKANGISLIGSGQTALDPAISNLVESIFIEAKTKLNEAVSGYFTARGTIETPLGTLSLSQIEKAEVILLQIGEILKVIVFCSSFSFLFILLEKRILKLTLPNLKLSQKITSTRFHNKTPSQSMRKSLRNNLS